ncbi:MAG: LamG-like jellyroll fold domain-containing protein, partial [Patescibacteria group bacterium]
TGAVTASAGHWGFDETSGTSASDSSGNGRSGNLRNGPAWISGGKVGGALSFDGIDDYVYANLPASDFINNISISIWVKTGSASQSILGFTNNLPIGWVHDKELFIDAAGKVNFRFYPQGTIQSTLSINDGNWHHIAALYALDNSMQMYIDSIPQALLSAQGQSASYGGYFTVGIQSQDYGYFNGIIDEVKIFNYALSAAEVNSIYSAGNSSGTTPPQGETTPAAKPDLDVTYIERAPRYERYNVQYSTYNNASIPVGLANAGQREPAPGETVTFIAHMQNRGSVNSGQFQYSWKINDAVVYSGVAPSLAAGASQTASYQWQWQNNPDFYVEFTIDANNAVSEEYEQNNSLRDKVNGYSLRI